MNSTNAIVKGLPIWVALLACLGWMSLENHAVAQPAEFEFSPTNSSGTFYGQATVNGVPANGNDWVAAFDMAGNCAGAAQIVLNDGLAYINLAIYGDDMTTAGIDEGITGGEEFTLHLWRAASGTVLNYPAMDAILAFSGWTNTNGAPMPGFDDPTEVFNFEEAAIPPSISGPESTCLNADPFALATAPAGGVLVGPGLDNGLFNPALAGEGVHTVDYIVDGVLASWTITVLPTLDATILTEGPFCEDDDAVVLEAVTAGGVWVGDGVFDGVFDPAFVTPGTVNVTHTLGEPEDACYDTDQQALTVYPSPFFPTLELIQPSAGVFHGVVPFGQTDVEYSWYNMMGELLAEGDTLYNVEEGDFLFQATNTYGCTSTWTWAFAFPGVQDLQRAIDWTWLSPTTVELSAPVERVALHNALGHVIWEQRLGGARRAELPLAEGDGWRLIRLELVGGGQASQAVVR